MTEEHERRRRVGRRRDSARGARSRSRTSASMPPGSRSDCRPECERRPRSRSDRPCSARRSSTAARCRLSRRGSPLDRAYTLAVTTTTTETTVARTKAVSGETRRALGRRLSACQSAIAASATTTIVGEKSGEQEVAGEPVAQVRRARQRAGGVPDDETARRDRHLDEQAQLARVPLPARPTAHGAHHERSHPDHAEREKDERRQLDRERQAPEVEIAAVAATRLVVRDRAHASRSTDRRRAERASPGPSRG